MSNLGRIKIALGIKNEDSSKCPESVCAQTCLEWSGNNQGPCLGCSPRPPRSRNSNKQDQQPSTRFPFLGMSSWQLSHHVCASPQRHRFHLKSHFVWYYSLYSNVAPFVWNASLQVAHSSDLSETPQHFWPNEAAFSVSWCDMTPVSFFCFFNQCLKP